MSRFIFFSFCLSVASAWVVPNKIIRRPYGGCSLKMAIDYNDPLVGEELGKIMPMTYEEVEEELQLSGVRGSPTMNDMDLKLMLVEVRLRAEGKLDDGVVKEVKTSFDNNWEELMYTKPYFKAFYDEYAEGLDQNAMNVIMEYCNEKDMALERYGKDYKALIRKIEEAINFKAPITSPTIVFSGFPANMGEEACKMTLEAVGAISEFECIADEDMPILTGKVTFEDIEDAKKACEQYDGMDMGMGTLLKLGSEE